MMMMMMMCVVRAVGTEPYTHWGEEKSNHPSYDRIIS